MPSNPYRNSNELSRPIEGTGWRTGAPHLLPSHAQFSERRQARSILQRVKKFFRSWSSPAAPPRSAGLTQPMTPLTQAVSSNARFILLCSLWYATSALSSNTGKAILNQFRYPITLTFIQFGFVATYCLLFMTPIVRFSTLRRPTRAIIRSTLPMGMFQVGGHVFSSIAISRIPVSTVHTIKALSPLFTVAAYAMLFGVSYSAKTYISLLPLTLGVMLACSFDMSASNIIGLGCAFGSALVFVSSNIFFKKIMPSSSSGMSQPAAHKLDKLNLLFFSSSMAFLLMVPIWLYYDLPVFLAASSNPDHVAHPGQGHSAPHHSVAYYFFMNGTVHFTQNIIAFVILSSTSPVTYSIASLIKRVAVICIAIVWFQQIIHPVQGFGIVMTFAGLYMYNNAKGDVEKGEKKMRRVEAARDMMLPSTNAESRMMGTETPPEFFAPPPGRVETTGMDAASVPLYGRSRGNHHHNHHHHNGHAQVRPPSPPTLTITVPAHAVNYNSTKDPRVSPVDSYPSPPASLDDSPPMKTVSLESSGHHGHDRLGAGLIRVGS